jgi:hypothetical protein
VSIQITDSSCRVIARVVTGRRENRACCMQAPCSTSTSRPWRWCRRVGQGEEPVRVRVQKGEPGRDLGPEPVQSTSQAKAPDQRITSSHGKRGDNITAVYAARRDVLGGTGRLATRTNVGAESEAAAPRHASACCSGRDHPACASRSFKVTAVEPVEGKGCAEGRVPK